MMLDPKLFSLIVLFVVCAVLWLIVILYRGRLMRDEEDKVFLASTREQMGTEQQAIMKKVSALSMPIWILGVLAIIFLLASIALWIYQGLMA